MARTTLCAARGALVTQGPGGRHGAPELPPDDEVDPPPDRPALLRAMRAPPIVYRVEDRSILLPYYKRLLIDPALPLIPRSISPNAITHAGHLLNLAGVALLLALRPHQGVAFAAAAALLLAYVWCDNADGGHARRTGQCSALGEFLDHGLDALNVVYIAVYTCIGLGVTPGWWVALTLIIPTAATVTYWEQSHTGTFHLGLLNQVESTTILAGVLLACAALGDDFAARLALGGVSLQTAFCVWTVTQIAAGIVNGLFRVARKDPAALVTVAPLFAFDLAVAAAFARGALDLRSAVLAGAAGNVYLGLRMLVRRLGHERPGVDPAMLVGTGLFALAAVTRAAPRGEALAALAFAAYGALAARDVRVGLRRVGAALETRGSS